MLANDGKLHSLFGSPVAHSLSPVIFNTTFEKLGMNRAYVPFEVRSGELEKAVEAARALGIECFNVTMPHKIAILEFLEKLDETAESVGAVNTVSSSRNEFVGHNTDGEGAELAIKAYDIEPTDKRILIIGAGGASRAIAHRMAIKGNSIRIISRNREKARETIDEAEGRSKASHDILSKTTLESSLADTDLIINATPVQTAILLDQLEIPRSALNQTGWTFDLAYDKPLVEIPAKIRRISPLEMLLQQAALSYEKWFNEQAPLNLMRSALVDYLGWDWR